MSRLSSTPQAQHICGKDLKPPGHVRARLSCQTGPPRPHKYPIYILTLVICYSTPLPIRSTELLSVDLGSLPATLDPSTGTSSPARTSRRSPLDWLSVGPGRIPKLRLSLRLNPMSEDRNKWGPGAAAPALPAARGACLLRIRSRRAAGPPQRTAPRRPSNHIVGSLSPRCWALGLRSTPPMRMTTNALDAPTATRKPRSRLGVPAVIGRMLATP